MKTLLKKVIDEAFDLKNKKVTHSLKPEDLKSKFDLAIKETKQDSDLEELITKILNYSVNTQNPRFLNQLFGGSTKESWLGELLAAILNTSMATYEISPLATLMELEVISEVNKEVGFDHAEGIFAPGGSYANMLGIHCARFYKNKELKNKGMYSSKNMKVFVSKDAHYSTSKALDLLGIGIDAIVKVETNDEHKMEINDLENKIKDCLKNDCIPLAIVSTAGTTVWGAFDPIDDIDSISKKYNIWHHVDAAWGGLGLWDQNNEKFFKGIEKVDSITIDFHKLLASTLTKGLFLTSHKDILKKANSGGGDKYIFHNKDSIDMGPYSIQCGRKVSSLPIWLQWRINGTSHYRKKFKELYDLSKWAFSFLKTNSNNFKILHEPEYMNICFQVIPSDKSINIGEYNKELRVKLLETGNFMVNISSTKEHGTFFRLVLNHWDVNQEILKEFFEELLKISKY